MAQPAAAVEAGRRRRRRAPGPGRNGPRWLKAPRSFARLRPRGAGAGVDRAVLVWGVGRGARSGAGRVLLCACLVLRRCSGGSSGASAYDARERFPLGGRMCFLPASSLAFPTAPAGRGGQAGSARRAAAWASAPEPERAASSHGNGRVTTAHPAP